MPLSKHMIDNRDDTVADHLRRNLSQADFLHMVSAYFSIYGYELLQTELEALQHVRFLYGEPTSTSSVDPGQRDPKSFAVTEDGLRPDHALVQKFLARQCCDWIKKDSVEIKSISQSNFLHGKMYLTNDSDAQGNAIIGSSNFTKSGLGGGERPNIEINLQIDDRNILDELTDWFEDLWHNELLTREAKQEVINALNRLGKEHSPEIVYYKTLYELFRDEIERIDLGDQHLKDVHLYDTQIWKILYQFQKDAVHSIISRLNQHNGCILADSVGLGKTYTALAVIKYFELRNQRVLVLYPKKLERNWSLYPAHVNSKGNPFEEDRFAYSLRAHTDLSRESALDNFNWSNYDLIVIDESHNFRNHEGKRYQKLLDEVISSGAKTKVLMLSATPVNTSLIDLRNQIYLMTERREDSFRESLGVGDIGTMLATAQREFKRWEEKSSENGRAHKNELIQRLGTDFFRLLAGISISRSRRHIENFYADEMARIGTFPERAKPKNFYPNTDIRGQLKYDELADQIEQFQLSVYQPSKYINNPDVKKRLDEEKKELRFNQADREQFLIGMIRTNFLKRLESSAHSLTLTLGRTINKIDTLLENIDRFEHLQADRDTIDSGVLPDDDDDDEEFLINRARNPYRLSDLNLDAWKPALNADRVTLQKVLDSVKRIDPERDGKLQQIKKHLLYRVQNPTFDQDGRPNYKILIFTTFKDTAIYLYENLKLDAEDRELNIAMVSGDQCYSQYVDPPYIGSTNFNDILTDFAPVARNKPEAERHKPEIDILVATDCISEGQNLQDCDTVLNYDIHWNPVRVIQRFGRIDRIGSRSQAVHMMNYWPTTKMEKYLRLKTRVQARMALANTTATGDDNILDVDAIQTELNFRDAQLKQLIDNIPDLEDLNESVSMSDFTLDYFYAQLRQYLEKNKDELEATPHGAYAVAPTVSTETRSGVIWCLRQRKPSTNRNTKVASPVHPYYLAYVRENGDIRYGCANTKQVLDLFENAAIGLDEPILSLCDQFDRETQNGRDMSMYDDLLDAVVRDISRKHGATQAQHLGLSGSRDFKLPKKSETPHNIDDFELITWLVLKPGPA